MRIAPRSTLALLTLSAGGIAASAIGACGKSGAAADKGAAARPAPAAGSTPAGGSGAPGAAAAKPAPARGPENPLFKLDDNRLLAHVQRQGGLLLLPGSGAFAKYTHFGKPKLGWKMKQSVDGQAVGVADKYADVDVPLTAEQAQSGKVTLRLKSPSKRLLELKPNGQKGASVQLEAGWQTISADVPGLIAGENRLQIVTGGKGENLAIAWIQLGGSAPADVEAPPPPIWDAKQKALALAGQNGLAYYAVVPESGRLVGSVIGDGCQIKVNAQAEGAPAITGTLSGAGAVELGALAGMVARLELTADGCKRALVADAALVVPGAPPQVKKDKKPKYVVLWIMDSLRADRTRPYNPKARPEAPNFEKLSQKGAAFLRNYVQGNESKASHASIWSSTWTGTHRFIPGGNKGVPAALVTIDEIMKAAGFWMSGVSANGYITKGHGFGDGWDKYRNHIHDGGGVRGEDIMKFAVESIQDKKDKPWFLYMGMIDTHVSWRAKEPWMSQYDPGPYTGKYVKEASGADIDAMAGSGKQPNERDKQRIRAIYDSNVSYQDDLLGKFYGLLEQWGIADDTMLIVTADHGDEQWENGRVGHGASLRESLIHVPLLVVYPPLVPGGVVDGGTDTIDIVPTIVDALGLALPDTAMGESLIPLAQGVGRGYPRCSIGSMYENAWAIRIGDWKARVPGSGIPLVFDIGSDYMEQKDLATTRPLERRLLTDALSTFLAYQKQWKKAELGSANNMKAKAAELFE
jgi:arylsulfatase A-like enzyme